MCSVDSPNELVIHVVRMADVFSRPPICVRLNHTDALDTISSN